MTAAIDPAQLAPHYARFRTSERVLLTGHSHQAWPDVAREGLVRSFDDAALHVDDKWAAAMAASDAVRAAVATRIGARPDEIALADSSHALVVRFLSALDRRRPRLVTTEGEFHSMRRQLSRLEEEGLEVTWVAPDPVDTLAERLAAEMDERCAALMVSTVLFQTAAVVPSLRAATEAATRVGAAVLLDAYHGFSVVPMSLADYGAAPVFVTGGGYKYAQWGEGCCFLRVPERPALRPVVTGWFSDFESLSLPRGDGPVRYGPRPADRFAGSTYDPASHYRARAVVEFFDEQRMTVSRLRALSLSQTGRLIAGIDDIPGLLLRTPREDAARGGFVTVQLEGAGPAVAALRGRRIFADSRGDLLRLGPAPYVTDAQLEEAIGALREVVAQR